MARPTEMTFYSDVQLSGTPTTAGMFNFTAQVTDQVGSTATKPLAVTIADPFNDFLTTHGLPAGSGGVDSDGDGFVNLLEFILRGNPTANNPSIRPTMTLNSGVLTYEFSIPAATGNVAWKVQYTSDLVTWTDAVSGSDGVTITSGPVSGGTSVAVSLPATAPQRFVRLFATGP